MLTRLDHWVMVEVFAIGVIVSLVKIADMATLVLGLSFWTYTAFALCYVLAISTFDRLAVWSALEQRGAS
jgi:paraquat-inducible protein A